VEQAASEEMRLAQTLAAISLLAASCGEREPAWHSAGLESPVKKTECDFLCGKQWADFGVYTVEGEERAVYDYMFSIVFRRDGTFVVHMPRMNPDRVRGTWTLGVERRIICMPYRAATEGEGGLDPREQVLTRVGDALVLDKWDDSFYASITLLPRPIPFEELK